MISKDEIIEILASGDLEVLKVLKKADKIRHDFKGDEIHLRALIEFSNICKCNCLYCGLRSSNKNIERYRLGFGEIVETAKIAASQGYKTIVLQSGEDNHFNTDEICKIIREIKKLDVALTLSIGEKSFDEYKAYKKEGADRYLLRIETTDENLYKEMHPKASFKNRLQCLENLKTLGFETGSGCLIGLKNQTLESIADDILFFKKMNFDMIGLGPFIPHPDTPLKDEKEGDFYLTLKAMALVRILMPDINIPATTAMETIQKNGRLIALQSGANVVMPNFTPDDVKKNYSIYPNKVTTYENLEEAFSKIGRTISKSKGFRKD